VFVLAPTDPRHDLVIILPSRLQFLADRMTARHLVRVPSLTGDCLAFAGPAGALDPHVPTRAIRRRHDPPAPEAPNHDLALGTDTPVAS
jgi:hypothetical protein